MYLHDTTACVKDGIAHCAAEDCHVTLARQFFVQVFSTTFCVRPLVDSCFPGDPLGHCCTKRDLTLVIHMNIGVMYCAFCGENHSVFLIFPKNVCSLFCEFVLNSMNFFKLTVSHFWT